MTSEEFAAIAKKDPVVLVPVGALEEHGRHLPLGADLIQPLHVLDEVAKRTGAYLAPPIPYGVCTTTRPYPGTVSVSVDSLKAFVRDVLADLVRNGVRRVMIVSGQAGREHMMALRAAAEAALEYVKPGMVLGLGTGSTARLFLEGVARLVEGGMDLKAVPTSLATAEAAKKLGVPLTSLEESMWLDLCVDGADEVDRRLNLIKGLGGALFREKIVATASKRFVVVVDQSKLSSRLGTKAPVPVEAHPFGWKNVSAALQALGAQVELRLKEGEPFRTDNGNHILDAAFGPIQGAAKLASAIAGIPGVVGHGLFLGMAPVVLVGTPKGVRTLVPRQTT